MRQLIPDNIMELFGQEMFKYSIILFTHGDLLEEDPIEELIKENCVVRRVVDQCESRMEEDVTVMRCLRMLRDSDERKKREYEERKKRGDREQEKSETETKSGRREEKKRNTLEEKKLNVRITVKNHPKKNLEILSKSWPLTVDNKFQILTDIKIPDDQNFFTDDPLEKQYVYLQAQFPSVTLEKVVMVSFQSGYLFVQSDKHLHTG
ncbi:hypothetical protein QQF64_025713 [Cirrhinus molitorella]|uniref:Uncharacterized protein n=1 Tax=Cirrhinus molitorella TaxID=172907 RepID=A0ABR3NR88_9TELE